MLSQNSQNTLNLFRNFDSLQVRSFNLEMHQAFLNGIYFKQTPLGKSGLVVKFGFFKIKIQVRSKQFAWPFHMANKPEIPSTMI